MKPGNSRVNERSNIANILLGTVIHVIVFLCISLIFSAIIYNTKDPSAKIKLWSILSFVASGVLGSVLNAKIFKYNSKNCIISLITISIIYLAFVLIVNGKIPIPCIINAICFIAASMLFLFVSKGTNNGKKHKRRS